MKRISIIVCAFILSLSSVARTLTSEESLQSAISNPFNKHLLGAKVSKQYRLKHIQKEGETPLYYVFETSDGGFLMTGADDRANAVLGYTDEGNYDEALANPAFCGWLEDCKSALAWLSQQPEKNITSTTSKSLGTDRLVYDDKGNVIMEISYKAENLPASVAPLFPNIRWSQDAPYNCECPEIEGQGRCLTGCVATALSQVMKYYEWPDVGTGSHSYHSDRCGQDLSVDYSQSVYAWGDMQDLYMGNYTDQQAHAMGKLMFDVGVAVDMNYGISASSSYTKQAPSALRQYFKYNKNVRYEYKYKYADAEWQEMMKNELAHNRPILYNGSNYAKASASGHGFILDGYDSNGLFHVNWGWAGRCNGYFSVNFLNANTVGLEQYYGGYSAYSGMVYGIEPDRDGTTRHIPYYYLNKLRIGSEGKVLLSVYNSDEDQSNFKVGLIAVIDGVKCSEHIVSKTGAKMNSGYSLTFQPGAETSPLKLTPELLGDKVCYLYPVIKDGTQYYRLRDSIYKQQAVKAYYVDGKLVLETIGGTPVQLTYSDFAPDGELYTNYPANFNVTFHNNGDQEIGASLVGIAIYKDGVRQTEMKQGVTIRSGAKADVHFRLASNLAAGTYQVRFFYWDTDGVEHLIEGSEEFTISQTSHYIKDSVIYIISSPQVTAINDGDYVAINFIAANGSDYTEINYGFYVYEYPGPTLPCPAKAERKAYLQSGTFRLPPYGDTDIRLEGPLNLAPGKYVGKLIDLTNNEWLYDFQDYPDTWEFVFTVGNYTSVDKITDGTESEPMELYDVMGNRVKNPIPGTLYISKGKKIVY